MLLETFKKFDDFDLLDSGLGYRLERWGNVVLQRPDPQIIWQCSLPNDEWEKADAVFESPSGNERGRWEIKTQLPYPWVIKFHHPHLTSPIKGEEPAGVKFLLKLSPFKHTGLFAEQAANWEWMLDRLMIPAQGGSASHSSPSDAHPSESRTGGNDLRFKNDDKDINPKSKILNLFAYTGGTTIVLAKAGCQVTHVDASKPAITWANENAALNNLAKESVRWILDDAAKFVKREIKRGVKYDGIIMDPPAFGHSPTGKTWKFNDDLPGLLSDCVELLSENAKFLIVNGYATNSSALALNNLLEDSINSRAGTSRSRKATAGKIEFGELCLKQKNRPGSTVGAGRMVSTGIFSRWSA
jgi:23S rRNA (cytosine1962-C5)-methyltransferase